MCPFPPLDRAHTRYTSGMIDLPDLPGLPSVAPLVLAAERACAALGPTHDFQHVVRVVANARRIAVAEGARLEVVTLAALLHELVNLPKDHPESHRSGDLCADAASLLLEREGWPRALADDISACIRDHAFSKGALPPSLEGKVVQDADRLDAIGAIGLLRFASTCGELGKPLYNPDDPFCASRPPDDKRWGLDHVYRKLLRVPALLHTDTARAMAAERDAFVRAFIDELARELPSREAR